MDQSATVHLQIQDRIATITLNRADRFNTMTAELLTQMRGALDVVTSDASIKVLILTGSGRAFCAGGDLSRGAGGGVTDAAEPAERAKLLRHFMETSRILHEMAPITIAAINGACAGAGLSWACACDLRYASSTAKFNVAFLGAGLSGDFGGTWTLPRIIGYGRAREKYLLSEPFDAFEAERIGLVADTFEPAELHPRVRGVANRLASSAPLALSLIKQNLIDAETVTFAESLDRESERHAACVESADGREAARAFIEKRTPDFVGR